MMKRINFLFLTLVAFACQKEENARPANENTFIRYFGTEENNVAVQALETSDGYVLVSNTIIDGQPEGQNRMIKMIRTDLYGHQIGNDINYPQTGANWRATSFISLPGEEFANPGYLIIGDSIKSGGATDLLLYRTDTEGNMVNSTTISGPPNTSLQGRSVTYDSEGNFVVLASLVGHPSDDMYVAKINAGDFSIMWSRQYGDGPSDIVNKLFYTTNSQLLWATSIQDRVRLVQVAEDAEASSLGGPINSQVSKNPFDICPSIGGWAITGSTNESGNEDIFVMKVRSNSDEVIFSVTLPNEGNDKGVSIARTLDNGLIVLGTASTPAKKEDLSLAKLDGAGNIIWQSNYGGADRQEAASVTATTDGSYLIFGTTYFINEAKLMLVKVNGNGEL